MGRPSKAESLAFRAELVDIVREDRPMTVRQVYYQALVRGLIDKGDAGYDKVQTRLLRLREEGAIDWADIIDPGRTQRIPLTFPSLGDALEDTLDCFRLSPWADQGFRPEIWIEKEALAGVFESVTDEWCVPLVPLKGMSSASLLYEAAQRLRRQHLPAHIYYFGDYDPSGVLIPTAATRRLREFGAARFSFELVALRPEQIEAWNLPTRPTKAKGTHAKKWTGGESVELDAIRAPKLRELARQCITRDLDTGVFEATLERESTQRSELSALIERTKA